MIKSVRNLTRMLGKLGIKILISNPDSRYRNMNVRPRPPTDMYPKYGLGLKEAKDFTENYLERMKHE